MSGALKAQIRAAVYQHCERTNAPAGHYQACPDDIFALPEADWPWYLQCFKENAA